MWPHSLVLAGLAYVLIGTAVGCEAASNKIVQRENLCLAIPGTEVSFEMVWIPEGAFWIGKTEVAWDEYLVYCDFENPARETGKGVDGISRPSKPLEDVAPFDRDWGLGRRPAVGMSWNAARRYCEWLSKNFKRRFRLPTESEWLLACGAEPSGKLSEFAWFEVNSDPPSLTKTRSGGHAYCGGTSLRFVAPPQLGTLTRDAQLEGPAGTTIEPSSGAQRVEIAY